MRKAFMSLLAATLALLLALPATAQIQFRTSTLEPLEQEPSKVATADLNGDEVADLVIGHPIDATVSVFLGDSQGGLLAPEQLTVGGPARGLLLHDVDEDTMLDILVAEEESDNVWFLHGVGDGTFAEAQLILVGHDPVDVAARDLDGDEHVDLAIAFADEAGGRVSVVKGNGDGTFAVPRVIPLVSRAAHEVVIDDFNQDDIPDLAVSNTDPGSVSILLGQGELNFAEPVQLLMGSDTGPLALGDVNEDGRADLAVGVSAMSVSAPDTIAVFISRGDGTFDDPTMLASSGNLLKGLRVTDVDADHHLDIVVANQSSQSATVLLGAGDGTFAAPRGFIADVSPRDVAVFDVNRDGHTDIVTANQGVGGFEPTLAYLYGDGTGTFTGIEQITTVGATVSAAVADFDGDAIADAALLVSGEAGITLRFGAAQSPRRPNVMFALSATSVAIATADVDGDDRADVVTANSTPDLSFLFGTGQGTFDEPVTVSLGAAATALALGDCDGDGDSDVVIAEASTRIQVSIVRNNGGRTFATLAPTLIDGRTAGLAVSDFTGDRVLDIAVGDADGSRLVLLAGNGDCTFTQRAPTALPAIPVRLAAAKLADDNVDDLVVIGAGQRNLVAVLNDGSGAFTAGQPRSGGSFPLGVTVRDLNADAISEILIGDRTADAIGVIRRSGAGILLPEQEVLSSVRPAEIVTGDFDDDGRYDVLATGATTCEIVNVTDIAPLLRGDANGDGTVDRLDLTPLFARMIASITQ